MIEMKTVVFKIKKDCICEATNAMNTTSEWFRSLVVDVEKNDDHYLVIVKSTFDYPCITNEWDEYMYEETK